YKGRAQAAWHRSLDHGVSPWEIRFTVRKPAHGQIKVQGNIRRGHQQTPDSGEPREPVPAMLPFAHASRMYGRIHTWSRTWTRCAHSLSFPHSFRSSAAEAIKTSHRMRTPPPYLMFPRSICPLRTRGCGSPPW